MCSRSARRTPATNGERACSVACLCNWTQTLSFDSLSHGIVFFSIIKQHQPIYQPQKRSNEQIKSWWTYCYCCLRWSKERNIVWRLRVYSANQKDLMLTISSSRTRRLAIAIISITHGGLKIAKPITGALHRLNLNANSSKLCTHEYGVYLFFLIFCQTLNKHTYSLMWGTSDRCVCCKWLLTLLVPRSNCVARRSWLGQRGRRPAGPAFLRPRT